MPGEKSKMLAGALYDARDPELSAERCRARALCAAFNTAVTDDDAGRATTLSTLLNAPTDASIQPPLFCDVWVGGGSVICPGVRIGDGSVIGAGSVVTRDIPAGVVAAGNPCRVIRAVEAR